MTITTDRCKPGFTLIELMVALTIGTVMIAGAMASIINLSQSSNSLMNYVDMNTESRYMLEIFGRDIRGATNVSKMTSENLIITTTGPDKTNITVEYLYEPTAQVFYRIANGETDIMLNDVEDLDIRYYSLRLGTATIPLEVKHIQLEAIMKQSSLRADNTNHIISAQFMLRNKPVSGT